MRRVPVASLVAVLAFAGAGCTSKGAATAVKSPSIAGVEVFSGLTHKHVLTHLTYPQNPPVGGNHSPYVLACAVYRNVVPNEFAVHSLEHGAVWLTYQPDVPAADVNALGGLASLRPAYTLVSPYPGQPGRIMATAWGLQLSTSSAQDPRLKEFVQTYAGGGQGGEPGASCKGGVTPEQALTLYKG